ncbi:MAG TPA: inositol monophosphatase family protein [Micromonosporaceae bacterium]|nr:inositol monophosphatase family protein [Micromonosporaceae bacterium]
MSSHPARPAAEELLDIAVGVVREAADAAAAMRVRAVDPVATKSSATDVVTAADRAVEKLAVEALRAARPDDVVLGEEYGATGPAGEPVVRWLLDPIDGTVNYLYNLAPYAVSLAAEVGGTVVAGVVREVVSGQEWTAVRGRGARRDGRRLVASGVTELGQTLVATGFSYEPARRARQARVVAELLPRVRDIRRFGAASVDLCLTAEGRIDAYFEQGLHDWDYAAGGLIATEAGVRVTGLSGAAPGTAFVLAAPAGIYDALHDALVALDAAALG